MALGRVGAGARAPIAAVGSLENFQAREHDIMGGTGRRAGVIAWMDKDVGTGHAQSNEEVYELRDPTYRVQPVGWVQSPLTDRAAAPSQGDEGAPLARIVFRPEFREAARNLQAGDEVLVLTWLHQGRRDVLSVHPRGDTNRPREGVFTTRSPDRPNPIGLHAVTIETIEENAITVHNLEAIGGTPVLDIKPILGGVHQR